jgi:hypothetical protein
MNVLDKFFKKFSYKFDKGYPDMNNDQDVLLLESILNEILGEAFSLFPTTEDEISNDKIKELFRTIKSYPGLSLNDPLVLDPNSPNVAKISRSLQRDSKFIDYLNNELDIVLDPLDGAKWNGISIKWGEGSRGGRGIKSKGPGFEGELVADLELLNAEGISDSNKENFR